MRSVPSTTTTDYPTSPCHHDLSASRSRSAKSDGAISVKKNKELGSRLTIKRLDSRLVITLCVMPIELVANGTNELHTVSGAAKVGNIGRVFFSMANRTPT